MKLSILITALSCSLFSLAQKSLFGVSGGPTISGVYAGSSFENSKSHYGFFAGITYTRFLRPHFTLGFDAQYAQRGFQSNVEFVGPGGSYLGPPADRRYNFDYFSVPLKAGFYAGNRVVIFGNIGVVPAILMKGDVLFREYYEPEYEHNDITSKADRIDLGGLLEFGSGFYITNNLLFNISIVAQHSFTTYTNEDYSKNTDAYHRSVSFAAGLKLAFGKEGE